MLHSQCVHFDQIRCLSLFSIPSCPWSCVMTTKVSCFTRSLVLAVESFFVGSGIKEIACMSYCNKTITNWSDQLLTSWAEVKESSIEITCSVVLFQKSQTNSPWSPFFPTIRQHISPHDSRTSSSNRKSDKTNERNMSMKIKGDPLSLSSPSSSVRRKENGWS